MGRIINTKGTDYLVAQKVLPNIFFEVVEKERKLYTNFSDVSKYFFDNMVPRLIYFH